jgi:hypothetical protein
MDRLTVQYAAYRRAGFEYYTGEDVLSGDSDSGFLH